MITLGWTNHAAARLLALLLVAWLPAACGDDDDGGPSAGTGGDSGSGGSAAGRGGSGGRGGAGGMGQAGASAAGRGGSGGTAGAGASGSGGSTAGSGGSGGMDIDEDAGPGDEDGGVSECDVPSTWDGTGFDANAAVQLALRMRLQALYTRMGEAEYETPTATDLDDLEMLFEDGDPSLDDAITQTYAGVTADIFSLFVEAVGNTLDPSVIWNPAPDNDDEGGRLCGPSGTATSGCWIFSTGGVDLRQVFEKGAYQAVLYHQAHELATGNVTAATIDQIAALLGANSALDIDGTNVHASNYAKGMGFYGTIRGHLIAAKAYAEDGEACETELQGELDAILASWEQSQMARFVYYANRALELFMTGTGTEAQNAEALHWLGEGLGLAYGFKGLPSGSTIISDAQIDEILTLMKMPTVGTATIYEFRSGNVADLEDILEAFDLVQDVYDFSDDQMMNQFRVHPTTPG